MSILTNRGAASDSAFARTASVNDLSKGLLSFVRKALLARKQRLQLLSLDDRMLADIGISRADAYREAARSPFDIAGSR